MRMALTDGGTKICQQRHKTDRLRSIDRDLDWSAQNQRQL